MSEARDRTLDEAALGASWRWAPEAKTLDFARRQLCDHEFLLDGAFAPLEGFMSAGEYEEGVVRGMRLCSGVFWPIPVTLHVGEAVGAASGAGTRSCFATPKG